MQAEELADRSIVFDDKRTATRHFVTLEQADPAASAIEMPGMRL